MSKEVRRRQKYYFPNSLTRQLDRMAQYPLTVVEAPSGFGKTTAVREYLKEKLPEGICECWYTCLGEPAAIAWERLCNLFTNISSEVANHLKHLGVPALDTVFYMASCLKSIQFPSKTYLVVDNYQLLDHTMETELLDVFSMHENPNLHIVIITQNIKVRQNMFIHNNNIHLMNASAFFFDRDSTDQLLRLDGIRLSKNELERIFKATEGWVSAIRLQAIHLKETGAFSFSSNIKQLVKAAIWDGLNSEEKDFLLSVSILEGFTAFQAAVMLGRDSLPENIELLLTRNDFIRYCTDRHIYSIHSILRDYLQNRFYHFCTEEYRRQVFRKAGASCAAMGQNYPAAKLYYKIRDFDAILSLPFTIECMDRQTGRSQCEFIIDIADECPDETWCKYPFAMIAFGYYALMMGQRNAYQKLSCLVQRAIRDNPGFHEEELRRIEGEYILLTTAADFNDIPRVIQSHERALQLLGGPSLFLTPDIPWLYATPSVLNMFWREPGQLTQALYLVDTGARLYDALSNKHGSGYHILMRAEAMLLRGEADEAEILCHEAHYLARRYKQTCMCVCADATLAQIAILKGDTGTFFAAMENLQRYVQEDSHSHITLMVQYCRSMIGISLGIDDYIAPCFYDMESIREMFYAPMIPFAQVIHIGLLLIKKLYHEFYGVCYRMLDESEQGSGNMKYMMPRLYTLLLLVVAEHNHGRYREAENYLRKAFDMALPDRVYLPFAHIPSVEGYLSGTILTGVEQVAGARAPHAPPHKDLSASLAGVPERTLSPYQSGGAAPLRALYRRQQTGVGIIRKAILQKKSPLTPREREVALLAKERLTAQEIADKLFISKATVKTILHSAYTKLSIHSRGELALREF